MSAPENVDLGHVITLPDRNEVSLDASNLRELLDILSDTAGEVSWNEAPEKLRVKRLGALTWIAREQCERLVAKLELIASGKNLDGSQAVLP